MKPASEDLEQRRPVWEALSSMFLDTDISLARPWRARTLAESPYSVEELQRILVEEVSPICWLNFWQVAGEWAGFDPEWLERGILRRLRRPWMLRIFSFGQLTIPHSLEWLHTKEVILQLRAEAPAAGAE